MTSKEKQLFEYIGIWDTNWLQSRIFMEDHKKKKDADYKINISIKKVRFGVIKFSIQGHSFYFYKGRFAWFCSNKNSWYVYNKFDVLTDTMYHKDKREEFSSSKCPSYTRILDIFENASIPETTLSIWSKELI